MTQASVQPLWLPVAVQKVLCLTSDCLAPAQSSYFPVAQLRCLSGWVRLDETGRASR